RLAGQHDLQELARGRLEGREDADLLERLDAHLLGLVEDQEHRPALRVGLRQVAAERGHQRAHRRRRALRAEVVQDRLDELDAGQKRVHHEDGAPLGGHLAHQRPTQRRLTGADLADERHQAPLGADAVEQRGQRVVMAPRREEKGRVGGEAEGRTLELPEGLVHRGPHLVSARVGSITVGVRITISSSPVELSSRLLKSQPSTGILPNVGTSRTVVLLVSLVTPPTPSRRPCELSTSVSWRRLNIDGVPCTLRWPEKSGSLFSNTTFIRILVSRCSLITRGVTSSLRRASLNCTWLTPWVGVLTNGTSNPRAMVAFAFSTVTTFGSARVRALPFTSRAWMARFRLKLLPTMPSRRPAAGLATVGSRLTGRFTRLPPSGTAVAGSTGRSPPRFRLGLTGLRLDTPVPGGRTPWNPWPTSVDRP